MAKERALTLEALRVMDAIDRRGSFAAAADELGRVPSALSYTMQKLEEELDVVLFDRSGHRTKFTNVGRMLLERGRVLLEAADKLTTDAEALARGWETHLTIVTEALVPTPAFFPLIDKLAAKMDWYLKVLKNYVGFRGRARRKEYWMFILVNIIFTFVLGLLDKMSGCLRHQRVASLT
ncbi:LysR family transcriptional regulator, partial [Escherichia sp. TWPC-MK]